ncbi:MAG TPA: hypothetical protein VF988_08535 [Verrucomicrobiae bacterium]
MSNQSNIPDQLRAKFPNLQPIQRLPTLMRINGCGVGIVGKRDHDPETHTYVKTYCVCVLFIPVLALSAYRVANAPNGGWYFIGKEPISGFARSWNLTMALLAVVIGLSVAWNEHTSSPEYQAQQAIKRADAQLQSGNPVRAGTIYREHLRGPAAPAARQGIKNAIDACLQASQASTVAAGLHLLATLPAEVNQPAPLEPDAFARGLELAAKFRTKSATDALEVLKSDAELDPTNAAVAPLQISLLKEIVAANPNDTNRVVELAMVYESHDQLEDCWPLLRPYKDRLGATEGARILGQKLLQERNYADAYSLLFPYVQTRLDSLRAIEASYTNTMAIISHQAIADLKAGRAGEDFYSRYKAASREQKEVMVDEYIEARVQGDARYQRSLGDLKEANRIVPVTLDLGIVQLNRAQELTDPGERKTELLAAEKTFLAIRGFAGQSDEYRMFLGEVYYWLGRSAEGRALFDQLLASRKRNYSILMTVGQTLREVGETGEAQRLTEEAYRTTNDQKQKYQAAMLRAILSRDEDEQIGWLEKSDPNSPSVQIELNEARGRKALQQANKPLAAEYLRKAVAGYENQTKSSAVLNNCALACFDLYQATGNLDDRKRGLALMEEAMTMAPGNSILLQNSTTVLIRQAVLEVNRDAVNVALLGEDPGVELLALLYQDEAGRNRLFQQLHDTETMKKGLDCLDRTLLLAPKNLPVYGLALAVHGSFHDLAALQKLQQRFQTAAVDLSQEKREALEDFAGAKDKDRLEKIQNHIRSLQETARRCQDGNDLTLDYIAVKLSELQQGAWMYGAAVEGKALTRAALASYQKHPSSATRQALESAYLFAANETLAGINPEYAALVKQTRHSVPPQYLISFVLERGGALAELVRGDADVAKAVALEKEIRANFPAWPTAQEWALLHTLDPQAANDVAQRIKDTEAIRLVDSLQYQMGPWNAPAVMDQYWMQRLLGNEQHGREIYQAAIHDGVPLPAL